MATVEGIRTPIVLDLTDIPRSVKAVIREIHRLKKTVGDVDIKLDGKYVRELSKEGVKPLIKDFEKLTQAAKRAKANFADMGKVLKQVTAGGEIGKALHERAGLAKGVGPATREAMMQYKAAQAAAAGSPGSKEKRKNLEVAQKRLIALLQQAQKIQQKTMDQAKKTMTVQLERSKKMSRFKREEIQENKQLYIEYLRQMRLLKQGKLTTQEIIRLSELANKTKLRGLHITQKQEIALKRVHKVAKKAGASGAGLMGKGFMGRVKWFAQLRILWGVLTVVDKIKEEFIQMDRAVARAMRTMVRGAKDYNKIAEQVRKQVVATAAITGATYEDIGEALYQLSSAGLTAEESMSALNSTVKLAQVTESNMTDTTKVVAGAFNNFKDSITGASNTTEKFMKISGTLSYVWKRNQIDMNELVQGLNQSAQSGKLAGLQFEELAVILGNMGTRMIRSGRAGRMFRSAIINIAQKSEKVKEVFDITFDPQKPLDFVEVMTKMNEKWKDSNKSAATTAAIFDIFGKRGAPALISILDSWEKIKGEMDGIGSAYELAIKQHETMLLTQQHYRELTNTIWKEMMANLELARPKWLSLRSILKGMAGDMQSIRVSKEAALTTKELTDVYINAGQVTERLVAIEAQRNIRLAQGAKATEPMIKNYDKLIKNLKLLKDAYEEVDKKEAEITERRKQGALTEANLRLGAADTARALREWDIKAGRLNLTLKELAKEGEGALQRLTEAQRAHTDASALAHGDIAEVPAHVTKELKDAYNFYWKLRKQYYDRVKELDEARTKQGLERPPRPVHQREDVAAGDISRKPGVLAGEAEAMSKEHQQKSDMFALQQELDQRMKQRNLSVKEEEEFERQRKLEKLAFDQMILDERLAMIQKQIDAEIAKEQLAFESGDVKGQAESTANIERLRAAEADLQKTREVNSQAQGNVALKYDEFQKKRITGIAKEKGAVAASKEMWKTYGDTIGSYAGQMADQVANMFAEMGKESKGAWDVYKAIAISQAIIDTYKTAQAGASALAGIPFVGPALAGMWIATSVMSGMMRVQQIRSQKPQKAAHGGVLDSYAAGGVTSGMTTTAAGDIIGDNPSGKELVIPSENIYRNHVEGEVREQGGQEPVQVINMVTQGDIAQAMSESEEGKNVVINHIGRDMNEKGSTYHTMKKSNKKEQ